MSNYQILIFCQNITDFFTIKKKISVFCKLNVHTEVISNGNTQTCTKHMLELEESTFSH